MSKIHLFDFEHYSKFPEYDKDKFNTTKCGYVRENITHDIEKVTCKLCLKEINKKKNINEKLKVWLEKL